MLLPTAKPSDLEALARREAQAERLGSQIDASDAAIGVASGGTREPAKGTLTREVSVVTASSSDIRTRLQPIVDAGFTVEGVTTPTLALCSLARRASRARPRRRRRVRCSHAICRRASPSFGTAS